MVFANKRYASLSKTTLPLVLMACVSIAGCQRDSTVTTGGNYAPVTAEQLSRAGFSHRTGQEKFDFDWKFQTQTFAIEGPQIPADLKDAMLGPGETATRISGLWSIRDTTITFTMNADEPNERTCSFPIYSTGVIRIETPDAQYVF